jgi:hypothetical protein
MLYTYVLYAYTNLPVIIICQVTAFFVLIWKSTGKWSWKDVRLHRKIY